MRRSPFSFQTKVLLPVLGALVLLPAVTLWIVNGYISRQVQNESRQTLVTAEAVCRNWLDIRTANLASRFRNTVNDPRFKAVAQLGDPKTLSNYLREILSELRDEDDWVLFSNAQGRRVAAAQRDTAVAMTELEKASDAIVHLALNGDTGTGTISSGGRTFTLVSVPVIVTENGPIIGALTLATRVSDSAVQELKKLSNADILLVAGNAITASTIRQPELPRVLFDEPVASAPGGHAILAVELQGERYLALAGDYGRRETGGGFRYILLSSYEARLRELEHTRFTLLAVSLAGVLVAGIAVWFLIRRITRPLLTLRDAAEAVGRGDFTQRIERFSHDECGQLAESFNRMTQNLQSSRQDLETAVQKLKATQAQLIQSEKLSAVGQFVAGIAHELNNPLTTVIGFSELLQMTSADAKQKDQLDRIAKSATRCHKIVHSLLGFSRQHEPERKLVQLHEVVDAVIDILAYDMRTNNIALVREYAPDLPPILADAHQLQQVILNILSNARQAIEAFRRDGRIVIRTSIAGRTITLRIKDNGPGIRRENLSKIFDPFFTTKPQGKGTGLGLSLSYGIIQEHHGNIRVESEPGDGAEFVIELPVAETATPAVLFDGQAPGMQPDKLPTLHVLVVDDEESILQLIRDVLVTDGHHVETAGGGQAALELIARNHYDVIISDWKMPGLNGMQIHEDLLTQNSAAAKRMLFMTGDVVNDTFQDFLRRHNRACLPKPFSLREFHATVAKLLAEN